MCRVATAAFLVAVLALPASAGTWLDESFTNIYGTRTFRLFVPAGYTTSDPRPLLVGIHGCTQTAEDFAGLSRIGAFADEHRLLVLMPEQSLFANASRCWNWFLPVNQKRGQGEPSIIKGMIDRVLVRYRVDESRIYVFGVSSGGYLTSTMLACYPDVFAAGMVASGGMYEAAGDVFSAASAALYGSTRNPKATGENAFRCSGSTTPRVVPLLVFHGADDAVVNPLSGQQVVEQFIHFNDRADDGLDNDSLVSVAASVHHDRAPGGLSYLWSNYIAAGQIIVQHYVVLGMAHSWSGGDPRFPYAEIRGPDETAILLRFFQQHRSGDGPRLRRRAGS